MHFFPFLILGLLNGIMVGLIAGLVARGIAPGDGSVRFRDTAALGMLGSLAGGVIATMLNANDGYLVPDGPIAKNKGCELRPVEKKRPVWALASETPETKPKP